MTLEDRYSASNKNTRNTAYSGVSNFLKDTSKLNIDRIPSRYNVQGNLVNFAPNSSKLDIDRIPTKYFPK